MIELKPVTLNPKYCEKWNEHSSDFVQIYVDGKKVSDTLYRVGGLGGYTKDKYFTILKHVEEFYDDVITKNKKDKPHLAGHWCILNQEGVEMVVLDQFDCPYFIRGVIYSADNKYYNIETGILYCKSYSNMESKEFVFLNKI